MTQRAFRRRLWLRSLFFVAAAGALGVVAFGAKSADRMLLVALDGGDAAALCAREGLALSDFWQRAEVMGVGGVVVREEPLGAAARRGRLLLFSRDEVEKWRAAGLVSPSAALKPSTVWIKDAAVEEQVLDAAARYGLAVATSASAGYRLVNFPESAAASGSLEDGGVGVYDPDLLKSLEGRALIRVYAPLGAPESRLAPAALRWRSGGIVEAFAQGAQSPEDRALEARAIPVDAPVPLLLKTVYSHPARLLVLRLSGGATVEGNFGRLRSDLQELKRRGLPLRIPAQPPAAREPLELLQRRLIQVLLWLFGIFGPLLAARAGLVALKRTRVAAMTQWPVTTPVLQLIVGVAAAGAVAVAVGLAARSCFDSLDVHGPSFAWARASLIAPLVIALLTLYTIDPQEWREKLASPMRWGQALSLAAAAAAAVCLIEPRRLLLALHLSRLAALHGPSFMPWWWDWRWREILVGWPCLLQAFFLVNWRMDCPDCATLEEHSLKDPRFWFMLGLLAPIGITASVGLQRAPRDIALAQTGWAAAAGLALGAVLVAARLRALHGTKDPEHHRTIDLDSPA